MNKVFVSGCFDGLHSGHIRFFEVASSYGDLYVSIGSDATIFDLKGRKPLFTENERLYSVSALSFVKKAFVANGEGLIDFKHEFLSIRPDIFITNEDGDTSEKKKFCEENGVKYIVLQREPKENLPSRSTTSIRKLDNIPYRIEMSGGWLDQPFVSKFCGGPVITINIEPTVYFNERSGMATSTRRKAMDLWGHNFPIDDPEKLAKILFCYDNPPGTKEISGSQDAIGLVFPGINKLEYNGEYWPNKILSIHDEEIIRWIESCVRLIPCNPRKSGYNVFDGEDVTHEKVLALSVASNKCWDAICEKNMPKFGEAVSETFTAQLSMFPNMMNETVRNCMESHQYYGAKISGAGGGGYVILVTDEDVGIKISVRRKRLF